MAAEKLPEEQQEPQEQQQQQEQQELSQADFVKAFQDLARGERTAAALESHLDSLESKIDELLRQAEHNKEEIEKENHGSEQADKSSSLPETQESQADKKLA